MLIGELARLTNTQAETIRFYEREGLLPAPGRSGGNYRIYGKAHGERLSFVRHCRTLDMTLDEIRALLRFKDTPTQDCGEVNRLLDGHIGHVATRIRELRRLQAQLKDLRAQCPQPQSETECRILSEISAAASADHLGQSSSSDIPGTHGARNRRRSR